MTNINEDKCNNNNNVDDVYVDEHIRNINRNENSKNNYIINILTTFSSDYEQNTPKIIYDKLIITNCIQFIMTLN